VVSISTAFMIGGNLLFGARRNRNVSSSRARMPLTSRTNAIRCPAGRGNDIQICDHLLIMKQDIKIAFPRSDIIQFGKV